MLAADKLQLQSALKQQATALKEKEFNLHHSNLMTVGTQAAVLAGLDITMFIEFNPPNENQWGEYEKLCRLLKIVYYGVIVGAFCANMLVVSHTTALSVLGAGLALRGPDGSMMTATDGLYEERRSVFYTFGVGLALTVGSVLVGVWLLLRAEAAIVCWIVTLLTCRKIYTNYRRVKRHFLFDENDTVDFSDIMNGPAAIRGVPMKYRNLSRRKPLVRKPKALNKKSESDFGDYRNDDHSSGDSKDEWYHSDGEDIEAQALVDSSNGQSARKRRTIPDEKLEREQTF